MRLKGQVLAGNRATHPHNTYDHPESEVESHIRHLPFVNTKYPAFR